MLGKTEKPVQETKEYLSHPEFTLLILIRNEISFRQPGTDGVHNDLTKSSMLGSHGTRHRGRLYAIFLSLTMVQCYIAEASWQTRFRRHDNII